MARKADIALQPSGAARAISTICHHIYHHDGAAGIRRILDVLSLVKQHGFAVVEEAATTALELAATSYRFLKRHLNRCPTAPLARHRTVAPDCRNACG